MSFEPGSSPRSRSSSEQPPMLSSGGHVAIVGSGPSGCYTALAVRRMAPAAQITIFDSRAIPFGLLRYGVAPDHQGMKNVSKQFDRLFASDQVSFVGNTVVGTDLSFQALEDNFDAVVLATGLAIDRPLTVPTDPSARCYGAGQVLRYLNGDPDSELRREIPGGLGTEVVVVGTGNVAMDVARLLCKSDAGFDGSDVDDDARDTLSLNTISHMTMLSRGPRERVRWDASMFAELCALPGVNVYLDGLIVESSIDDAQAPTPARAVRVDVRFQEIPEAIEVVSGHTVVRTRFNEDPLAPEPDREDDRFTHRADTVITAMGFVDAHPQQSTPGDHTVRVGGCGSGALGNLAENRTLAKAAAQAVLLRLDNRTGEHSGLNGVIAQLPSTATTFDDWRLINDAEIERARPGRVRSKFTSWTDMADHLARSTRTTAG